MSALISVVRNARWIDLSPKHKELREYLEKSISDACVEGNPDKVIMVKGAFGIGKTNTLHYLFHYGWCKLNIPVLYVSLEKLYPILESYCLSLPSKRIGNVELGKFLDQKVSSVINALKSNTPNEDSKLFFFDWYLDSDLSIFCSGFSKLLLEKYSNDRFDCEEFESLTPELIKKVVNSGNRTLLLIDEFETKFSKLKSLIDASNGGELRELFDDVVEKRVSFNLIIGNGPASGYELKNEKTNKGSDDAESSRIIPKQIPFPLPEATKEFLGSKNKGLLNFAWWASRCRARHFLRLKEAVGSLDRLISKSSYAEFLSDFTFFSEPIESSEEGSSPITYVKTEYFNDFPEELKDQFLPQLIAEIKPIKISFEKYRIPLVKAKKFLFCSPSTINVSEQLMVALSSDINDGIIKTNKDEGYYLELDYDLTIRKYFDFFLKSISDENGMMVFGMTDDNAVDQYFCELFLIPLIHLTYDFIAQYEEESLIRNKQAAEFLLKLLSEIKIKSDQRDVRSLFPRTYSIFKKNDYLSGDGFVQLSLGAIRETFEQPIGEPRLNYKNSNLYPLIDSIPVGLHTPIFCHNTSDVELYFIPDLNEVQLKNYLNILKKYIIDKLFARSYEDGRLVVGIYYILDNEHINSFKKEVLYKSGDVTKPHPLYALQKFNIMKISECSLNFVNHTTDFLDSIIKIGLAGFHNQDLSNLKSSMKEGTIQLESILNVIKSPDWTERKETRRTIEHFEKLVFKNEKSEIKSIVKQSRDKYESKLEEIIPQKENLSHTLSRYILNDDLNSDSTFGSFTKKLINLFLVENKKIPEGFLDLLKSADDFKLGAKANEKEIRLSFYEFKKFIQTNGDNLNKHLERFSLDDSVLQNLHKLCTILIKEPIPTNILSFKKYLGYIDDHFIISYHKKLGNYSSTILSEALYNHCIANKIDLDSSKKEMLEKIKSFKTNINIVRTEITQTNDKIKELLKLEDLPFAYEVKLGEIVNKVATGAEKLLDKEVTISTCIVIHEIISGFDDIISNAKKFSTQLNQINNELLPKYNKVNSIQESVNAIYKDSFFANILNNVKGVTRQDGDYYWATRILSTIKAIPRYTTIFKNKDQYLPNETKIIDNTDLDTFIRDLNVKYTEKMVEIDKIKSSFDENVVEIKQLVDLETKLKELLTVNENE